MNETRIEKDPIGELAVPAAALYGVQTVRALQNFPISGLLPLEPFVVAQVWIKKAAAMTHRETGRLDAMRGRRSAGAQPNRSVPGQAPPAEDRRQ